MAQDSHFATLWRQLKAVGNADKPDKSDYFVTMTLGRHGNSADPSTLAAAEDAGALSALVARATRAGRGAAPVERWEPRFCGDLDMEIRADGTWYYLGTPIARPALVELFSSVLRKDADGRTYLVTPVEKVGIRVEDAPFVAVEMAVRGEGPSQRLTFRTNVGDVVEAGPDHPIRFAEEPGTGGLKPYVLVRGRLEALLSRPVAHELAALGEEVEIDGRRMFVVRSGGAVFPVMPVERLEAEAR